MKLFPFLLIVILTQIFTPVAVISQNKPFRQTSNITLDVILKAEDRIIDVTQRLQYINNSPDTLHHIFMHLWANGWKNKHTALAKQLIEQRNYDFHFADENQRGGYKHLEFKSSGRILNRSNYNGHEDISIIYPPSPILPGDTFLMDINYELRFPDAGFSRMGYIDGNYFATQWYPKPAVYDQHGWHPMPYLHVGEFYSSFGDYEVFITVPVNYTVASSGILQNEDEKARLKKIAAKTLNQERFPGEKANITKDKFKRLHFKQTNIHDFAWFASSDFRVLIDSVQLDNGEMIELFTYFTHDFDRWIHANTYSAEIAKYMSEKVGPYPWKQISVVQGKGSGNGAMEYPAITIIGDGYNTHPELEKVIIHELIHNWFYGILASNERKHPWIDEGFTSYYEFRYLDGKYPGRKLAGSFSETYFAKMLGISDIPYHNIRTLYYMLKAAQHLDQAPGLHSEDFSRNNYYTMSYYKASMAPDILENFIGTDRFDEMMQSFFRKWKFNHPYPEDIQSHFRENIPYDTDWFFQDLIHSDKKPDFYFSGIRKTESGYLLKVNERAGTSVPYSITAFRKGEQIETLLFSGSIDEEIFFLGSDIDRFIINYDSRVPEVNRRNNSINTSGFLRKPIIPATPMIADAGEHFRPIIYHSPIAGFNSNDGLMLGMAFYNFVFPVRKTDILVMPLYSSGRDGLSGTAWLYRDIYPASGFIHSLRAGSEIKQYGLSGGAGKRSYFQAQNSLRFNFNLPLSSKRTETWIQLSNFWVKREMRAFSSGQIRNRIENYYVNKLDFFHSNATGVNPMSFNIEILQADMVFRGSFTAKAQFPYNTKQESLHLRVFGGKFFAQPSYMTAPDFRFSLQGQTPLRIATYEKLFIGYHHLPGTAAGNQMAEAYGNFKFPTPLGLSWDWLAAINLAVDIPHFPLRIFYDMGTYQGAGNQIAGTKNFPWVSGLQVNLFNDLININIPLFYSTDIHNVAELNNLNRFYKHITYSMRLESINPLALRRHLHLL
jgi:hypothetical protein